MSDETTTDAPADAPAPAADDDAAAASAAAAESAESAEPVERDERREELLGRFSDALGDVIVGSEIQPNLDLWIRVSPDAWLTVAEVARHRLGARYFGFLSVIDWLPSPYGRSMDSEVDRRLAADAGEAPGRPDATIDHGVAGGDTRFQMLARLAHVGEPGSYWGITLKADIPDDTLSMQSWVGVYAGADWHEREAWEMFGITFLGHPGLRHMYLPGAFEGHPMRKDFPLLARQVKPWPGIVDVELMPTEDEPSADEQSADQASDVAGEAGADEGASS